MIVILKKIKLVLLHFVVAPWKTKKDYHTLYKLKLIDTLSRNECCDIFLICHYEYLIGSYHIFFFPPLGRREWCRFLVRLEFHLSSMTHGAQQSSNIPATFIFVKYSLNQSTWNKTLIYTTGREWSQIRSSSCTHTHIVKCKRNDIFSSTK